MSTSWDPLALIDFTCERCRRGFVPPRSGGSPGSRAAIKDEDQAFQAFVQSVRMCPDCRRFVCLECWGLIRGTCLTCMTSAVDAAFQPMRLSNVRVAAARPAVAVAAKRSGGFGKSALRAGFAGGLVLLVLGGGLALAAMSFRPSPSQVVAGETGAPSEEPATATSVTTETDTATPSSMIGSGDTATPDASAGPTEGGTSTAGATGGPKSTKNPGATKTPAPTGTPAATCTPTEVPTATPTEAPTATPAETPTEAPTPTP
jgi:hypothetical protein